MRKAKKSKGKRWQGTHEKEPVVKCSPAEERDFGGKLNGRTKPTLREINAAKVKGHVLPDLRPEAHARRRRRLSLELSGPTGYDEVMGFSLLRSAEGGTDRAPTAQKQEGVS